MPSTTPPSPHPHASVLRQRAATLRALAARIDHLLVFALDEADRDDVWTGHRARLCEQMLARNLHQLHLAADDLRWQALRLVQRADELDATRHRAA